MSVSAQSIAGKMLVSALLALMMAPSLLAQDISIQTEYGFTGEVFQVNPSSPENAAAAREMVDQLVAHDVRWLRMGVPIRALSTNPSNFTFNESEWAPYVGLYQYAISKGLKVYLDTYPSYEVANANLSDAQKNQAVAIQYQKLASYFPEVAVWQIYNEANLAHKDNYRNVCDNDYSAAFGCVNHSPTKLPLAYMNALAQTIAAARTSIKARNPGALITTNASDGDASPSINSYSTQYMSQLRNVLDIFSFDVYPANNANTLATLTAGLGDLKATFGDQVWVAETGTPSGTADCSLSAADVARQSDYFKNALPAIAKSGIKHVFVYEYRDLSVAGVTDCEAHFGLVDRNNRKKASFDPALQFLQLYSHLPLQGDVSKASQSLQSLIDAFNYSFGRAPTLWEVYGTEYDGWLNTVVSQNLSVAQIEGQNQAWLMSNAGANERQQVIVRAYQSAFGRDPTNSETQYWMSSNFGSYQALYAINLNWLRAPDGYGYAERTATIVRSYQAVFGRDPGASELSGWLAGPVVTFSTLVENHRIYADYH